ncbi:MAG: hypothetical protein ACFHHU_03270 [Porticoccaceae bacterium]
MDINELRGWATVVVMATVPGICMVGFHSQKQRRIIAMPKTCLLPMKGVKTNPAKGEDK